MYTKLSEEEDKKMVERWQKEAEGILIFVSPNVSILYLYAPKLEICRPVYSLPLSPRYYL